MKKAFATLFVLAAVGLTGCISDIFESNKSLLIGSWEFMESSVTTSYKGDELTVDQHAEDVGFASVTFNRNGTWVVTATIDGETLTRSGSYTVSGDQITTNYEDEELNVITQVVDIDRLDRTYLIVSHYDTEPGYDGTIHMVETYKRLKKE